MSIPALLICDQARIINMKPITFKAIPGTRKTPSPELIANNEKPVPTVDITIPVYQCLEARRNSSPIEYLEICES